MTTAEARKTSTTYVLRAWLEKVEQAGQLRHVEGASAEEIGEATDLLQHTENAPAVLFNHIPGYRDGLRVLVDGHRVADSGQRRDRHRGLRQQRADVELEVAGAITVEDGPVRDDQNDLGAVTSSSPQPAAFIHTARPAGSLDRYVTPHHVGLAPGGQHRRRFDDQRSAVVVIPGEVAAHRRSPWSLGSAPP